jgi:[protein-PII] uridylyltransferase
MLALLTYADIKSVNPEALSPWKAENIWQLYIAASNQLNRSVDQHTVHAGVKDENVTRLNLIAPALEKKVKHFLEGLPERYLKTHSPEEVLGHVEMANSLCHDPIQLNLRKGRHWLELTLVTPDRPALFAKVAGVLSTWGMNIIKANAFCNDAGVIVDTFFFTDRFRTLELNVHECDRFKRNVRETLAGEVDVERLVSERLRKDRQLPAKVKIKTKIDFDNDASPHSTVVQVIAQDRPGLLHKMSSVFAHAECNIEIALIETEGQMAIDVFYLRTVGAKLDGPKQEEVRAHLSEQLSIT